MALLNRVLLILVAPAVLASCAASVRSYQSNLKTSRETSSKATSSQSNQQQFYMDVTAHSRSDALRFRLPGARIVILKSQRKLLVYQGASLLRSFHIALGSNPTGTKERQGDYRTPEGEYYVCSKNSKSQYYLSLGLSYPNEKDAARGLSDRLITKPQYDEIVRAIRDKARPPWDTALGGEIFIHGGGTGRDWTFGCIALDNQDIKELYEAVPRGLPVEIRP